jgi:hypothetical protein
MLIDIAFSSLTQTKSSTAFPMKIITHARTQKPCVNVAA